MSDNPSALEKAVWSWIARDLTCIRTWPWILGLCLANNALRCRRDDTLSPTMTIILQKFFSWPYPRLVFQCFWLWDTIRYGVPNYLVLHCISTLVILVLVASSSSSHWLSTVSSGRVLRRGWPGSLVLAGWVRCFFSIPQPQPPRIDFVVDLDYEYNWMIIDESFVSIMSSLEWS